MLSKSLSKYNKEVLNQALHSLVLFSWSYYSKSDEVPNLDYIKKIGYQMFGLGEKELSQNEKLWQSILSEYNFRETDEFDLVIAKAVETGYVDEIALNKEAEKINNQVIAKKSISSFSETWRLYHDSFDNNEEEVIREIYDSFQKNTKFISPANFNGTVRLFRYLGRDKEANELIEYYIETRKDEKRLFDLDEYPFATEIDDKTIIDKFSEIRDKSKENRTIKEVLEAIAGRNSWGGDDTNVLVNASVDDYYNLFKSERGPHLELWVNTCLKFGRFTNASEKDKQIAGNATAALLKIASESNINARRVTKFGIKVKE